MKKKKVFFALFTTAMLILLHFVHVFAVEFKSEGTAVKALKGETVLWENVHDRQGRHDKPDEPGGMKGPVQIGDSLYYAIGLQLYEARSVDGVVTRRISLPGLVNSLTKKDNLIEVTVGSDPYGKLVWKRKYRVGPDFSDVPFFLSGNIAALMIKNDAEQVLVGIIEADNSSPKIDWKKLKDMEQRRRPEIKPFLESAVKDLEMLSQKDPTNPWYVFLHGLYLRDLGLEEEAGRLFESIFNIDEAYHYELLRLAIPLDEIDPALGDRAFEMGMRFLIANGFEREQMTALVGLIIHMGRPVKREEKIDPKKDLDRISRIGERIWTFAPLCEGVSYMFKGLAKAHQDAGDSKAAELWEKRTAEAEPYRVFGGANNLAEKGLNALNIYLASILAAILIIIVKSVLYFSSFRGSLKGGKGWTRWLFLVHWSKGEIVGFLVLFPVLFLSGLSLVQGIGAIGVMAGTPLGAINGSSGHPSAVEYWKKITGNPGGDFIHALTLHQAGETEEAKKIYEKLDLPHAKVNLGVILEGQGKSNEAKTLYEDALKKEPGLPEALHNLGRPVNSSRIKTAVQFGGKRPFLALTTPDIWSEAYIGVSDISDLLKLDSIFYLSGSDSPLGSAFFRALNLFILLAALIALVSLFFPSDPENLGSSKISVVGWALGFIVPGTSRRLSFLGPVILTAFITSAFVAHALSLSEGMATNYLAAIAIPRFNYFGLWLPVMSPSTAAFAKLSPLWWIILLLNPIILAVMEKVRSDPLGPFAKKDSGQGES
ncbi:tetratricopeptide repeat protein [Thermodesulfobacteriota bacterium]